MTRFTNPEHPNFWQSSRTQAPSLTNQENRLLLETLAEPRVKDLVGQIRSLTLRIDSPWEPPNQGDLLERRRQLANTVISLKEAAVMPLLGMLEQYKKATENQPPSGDDWALLEQSHNQAVLGWIIRMLGSIGDERAVGPLLQLGARHQQDVATALQRIGTPSALDAVRAWRQEQGTSNRQMLERKLDEFLHLGHTEPELMARIDSVAQRRNVDRQAVVYALMAHILPHLNLSLAVELPKLSDEDFAFLRDMDVEDVVAEMHKQHRINQLLREIALGDNQAALTALEELRTQGWLSDGSLRGMNPKALAAREERAENGHPSSVVRGGASLAGANLRGASLADFFLAQADLRGAEFNGADLKRANFSGANLQGANLSGAILNEARLVRSNMQEADLRDSNLSDANLGSANLVGADLRGAVFNENTKLPNNKRWTLDIDMGCFTDPGHPNFWRSKSRLA